MATIKFKNGDDYALRLARLETGAEEIVKKAIYEGARVVADRIKANLEAIPETKFRHLQNGEQFSGLPQKQKEDLEESFGITPIGQDSSGNWNAKIGFDGYGSIPTKQYPKGVPNQLLAGAVESGSSVRQKTPFVRTAVNATRHNALQGMRNVIDEEMQNIMK